MPRLYFRPAAAGAGSIWSGSGLRREWGGAALLATENAPPRKRARMAPSRSWAHRLASSLPTALLAAFLATDRRAVYELGLACAFIFSAVLVIIGLYVRVSLHGRRCLRKSLKRKSR